MNILERIYICAKNRNAAHVQRILAEGKITYRQAQVFCECKGDVKASEFIKQRATCKCGGVVDRWDDGEPTCGDCRFSEAMSRIEYGPKVNIQR